MNLARDFIILLILVIALFGINFLRSIEFTPHSTDGMVTSKTSDPTRKVNVLFIGNSYVFTNNLPEMVTDIASSDRGNHTEISVQSVVEGGATLADMWKKPEVQKALEAHRWDYVVLQEQSLWVADPAAIKTSASVTGDFADAIRQVNAKPVVFMTWMRAPGSDWYSSDPKLAKALVNPDHMQAQIHYYTNKVATDAVADVVPVGDCWAMALKGQPGLHFYAEDGSHPAAEGTYLAALMFYHYFTGRSVEMAEYAPEKTDENEIKYIKSVIPLCQALRE